jgi:hypothetical protein
MVVVAAGHLLQGNFKHGRTVAGQGPAANPATAVVVIDADHLVEVLVAGKGDAVALMERHKALACGWAGWVSGITILGWS